MKVKYKTYLQIAGNWWIVICYTRHGTGLQRSFSTLYFEDKGLFPAMQCKSKCHSTPHDCFFTFWHFYVTQELPPRQAPDLLTFRQQRIFSCLFNRRRKTRFKFITFSSASYTNYASAQERKPSSYQILRQIKGRNAWLEMLGVLSFLSWIRLHAED